MLSRKKKIKEYAFHDLADGHEERPGPQVLGVSSVFVSTQFPFLCSDFESVSSVVKREYVDSLNCW